MSDRAERLLGCALTFKDADRRTSVVGTTFTDANEAISQFIDVLMHEAHESMKSPLKIPPEQPYMHPVDMDTNEPGIVDQKEKLHIRRCSTALPRMVYCRTRKSMPHETAFTPDPPPAVIHVSAEKAAEIARKSLVKTISNAEKRAYNGEERDAKVRERKQQRANETPEEKQSRLSDARMRKEQKEQEKKAQEILETSASPTPAPPPPRPRKPPRPPSEDALMIPDVSTPLTKPTRRRVPGDKVQFYPHPLPHHRHLEALVASQPNVVLLPALLNGEASDEVAVIQGPPGTGKTSELIRLIKNTIATDSRVYLCAPTNVGAANLYSRCLKEGLGEEASLALAPDRVPVGTVVLSNDPARRIVCATISSRAGPVLTSQSFKVVMVDEAAQCMEALIWGLLRPEVATLIMAGDIRQLPACVSETGVEMKHERSMMERLASLSYENTTELTIQNRMCPEILAFPNDAFYQGVLKMGPHAPPSGEFEVVAVEGTEEENGTSYQNKAEATEVVRIANELAEKMGTSNVTILTPYTPQCRLLLAQRSGIEVHTVDSFQGRENEAIVLSCVRDGSSGVGFWSDDRRLTVALTRARRRLVVVASKPDQWPVGFTISRLVKSRQTYTIDDASVAKKCSNDASLGWSS